MCVFLSELQSVVGETESPAQGTTQVQTNSAGLFIVWQVCCVSCLTRMVHHENSQQASEIPPSPLSSSGRGVRQLTCALLTSFLDPLPLSSTLLFPASLLLSQEVRLVSPHVALAMEGGPAAGLLAAE